MDSETASSIYTCYTLVAIAVIVCTYLCWRRKDSKYNLPPGPIRFPIIGSLLFNIFRIENATEMRKKFGDVSTYYMGHHCMVFLNTFNTIKEASDLNTCQDRGHDALFISRLINPQLKGIIQSDYTDEFRRNRNLSLTILRDLGIGRTTMEKKILDEANCLVKIIETKEGTAFDPWNIIGCAVSNVIVSVAVNKRHSHDDPEFVELLKSIDSHMAAIPYILFINAVKLLRFIPTFKRQFKNYIDGNSGMVDYMWRHAQQQMHHFEPGVVSHFVDGWLEKNYDHKQKQSNVDGENLRYILRDFLLAGTETTTTSVKWCLILLANRPEIQAKLHEEMDANIGRERDISVKDRGHVPYLEAFLWEIHRYCSVVGYAVTHQARDDTRIGHYHIPAHTTIIHNLRAVHMNENTFGDPEIFRPSRFLTSDGKFYKHAHVIPFGIGKRSCIGELLARQELFIFIALLVQKFEFRPPEGVDNIDEAGLMGITYIPKRFNIRAILRR